MILVDCFQITRFHIQQESIERIKEVMTTDEMRRKISEANKIRFSKEEEGKKLSDAHKGKILSEEHKRKISESLRNRKNAYSV